VGTKVTFFLGNLMVYNVLCFDHRSVVSARVLYDDNPTVDLTQIQSALRNNQSTTVVHKKENVVSSFTNKYITNICPVYQTGSCRVLANGVWVQCDGKSCGVHIGHFGTG